MSDDGKALEVRVTGRVQGVSFRAWMQGEARARGLSGWCRNEADGSVRGVIAGPEAAIREMLAALEKGPPAARVDAVATGPADWPARAGFEISG